MRFVNDGHYLPADKCTDAQEGTPPWENKVFFVRMLSADSASEPKDFRIIAVKVLRNVEKEEELYVNYGPEYRFSEITAW